MAGPGVRHVSVAVSGVGCTQGARDNYPCTLSHSVIVDRYALVFEQVDCLLFTPGAASLKGVIGDAASFGERFWQAGDTGRRCSGSTASAAAGGGARRRDEPHAVR